MIKKLKLILIVFVQSATLFGQPDKNEKIKKIQDILVERSKIFDKGGYKILATISSSDSGPNIGIMPVGDTIYIEGYAIIDDRINFMPEDGLSVYKRHHIVGKKERPTDSLLITTSSYSQIANNNSNIFCWRLSNISVQRNTSYKDIIELVISLNISPIGMIMGGFGDSPTEYWSYGLIIYSKS